VYPSKRSVVFRVAPLLCALSVFPQFGLGSTDRANPLGEEAPRLKHENQVLVVPNLNLREYSGERAATSAHEREVDLDVAEPTANAGKRGGRGLPKAHRWLRNYRAPSQLTSTQTSITKTNSNSR